MVNSIASTLRSGRSSIVTVLTSSLQNPHLAILTQGLIDALDGSRYRLMFAQTGSSDDGGSEMLGSIMAFRPAAVVSTQGLRSETVRASLKMMDVPVLEMWHDVPEPVDMLVGFSLYQSGQLMAAHFAAKGYRHIVYSGHIDGRAAERVRGFKEGLEGAGASLAHVEALDGEVGFPDGMRAYDAIRQKQPQTDAIFFSSDVLATGASIRARETGARIPDDIALAGMGDLDFATITAPALTTIHVPAHQMGFEGGRMLLARLNGQVLKRDRVVLPTELKVRGSTGG